MVTFNASTPPSAPISNRSSGFLLLIWYYTLCLQGSRSFQFPVLKPLVADAISDEVGGEDNEEDG
jgi:hypothetical protein